MLPLLLFCVLVSASDWTYVKFSRKANTCDNNDRVIQNSTTKLVWSYSSEIPVDDNSIHQHENRGSKSIRFFEANATAGIPSDAKTVDVAFKNYNITFQSNLGPLTNYWCGAVRIPAFQAKQHIIRMDPILDARNKPRVHHILVYLCETKLNATELAYSGPCNDGAPEGVQECNGKQIYAAWAVGGLPFTLPSHLGLPLGPEETDMVMEIHYDNPGAIPSFVDSSGIRFTYTPTLRPNEAGIMGVGHITSPVFTIPPQQEAFTLDGWCTSDCTNNSAWMPTSGIKIAAGILHTHTAGRAIYLHQYRGGVELPPVLTEPSYDFNYQDFIVLDQERQVLPGDDLRVQCVYNTMDRTQPTHMALSTRDEMCLAFLLYYPRVAEGEEMCQYANLTGVDPSNPSLGPSVFCGGLYNATVPTNITAWTPPPCVSNPPSTDQTAPTLSSDPLDLSVYQFNTTLDDEGKYKLYWTVDRQNWVVHGAVQVQTHGWVGLGVSGNGGMIGSDVFIAYVQNGTVHFADRMAVQQALPPKDAQQDYFDVAAYQTTVPDGGNHAQRTALSPLVIAAALLAALCLH